MRETGAEKFQPFQIVFCLGPEWDQEAEGLAEQLRAEHVECLAVFDAQKAKETLLLTDDRETARAAFALGAVCIGCERGSGSFFEGAAWVTGSLEELDAQLLEEIYRHARGLPVTAARTKRLILREIVPEDFGRLGELAAAQGMEYLMADGMEAAEFFSEENLREYTAFVYRFYGYGLWSVLLHDGTLIGCCGFGDALPGANAPLCGPEDVEPGDASPWGAEDTKTEANALPQGSGKPKLEVDASPCGPEDVKLEGTPAQRTRQETEPHRAEDGAQEKEYAKDGLCLELQYLLAPEYRGKGYGTEMCRAALCYAFARTQARRIQISCRPENRASQALAQKLGFIPVRADQDGILHFLYFPEEMCR